ncbi:MAG: PAS domain S-box protein [Methanoregula sp.]|jgi:PAS domain S-box-containing protein|uniref:PAS domain-containing protein n=1 Tax=Methanoregula sp. TaxID=2052170 RepID=UPI0025CC649A|nr:PAS domain S-box protein [Methanoregula sp.]MCK9632610.1 PAS domain S-box protein [Methanoregula sp.]
MADIQDTDEAAQIRAVLREHPHGMSIKEISATVSMSRNSVAKYLEVMATAGQLDVRHVGNAKLYTLSLRVPVGDLLNHARELILVLDNDLRIVQASGSFCGFTGISRETILHSRLSALPIPLLSASEEREIVVLLNGGPTWKKEIHVIRNGTDVYFDSRFIPTVLENGVPGITLILEDITERTHAEKAMAERDRLLRTIFQIPTSPQFFIDRNHKVVYWDRALEIMTGIKAEEVVGTSCQWKAFYPNPQPCLADLLINGDRDTISRMFEKARTDIPVDGRYEYTDFFPDMSVGGKWLHITASLIRDTTGTITGAMEAVEDVTDKKKGHFVVQT